MLSELCVRRPVFATMLVMSLVVLGIFSFNDLGVDLFPRADPATVNILLRLPGAAPDEMTTSVVMPVENALSGIAGIDQMSSTINAGGSATITVRFLLERDLDDAANTVREKVAGAMRSVPPEVLPPVIQKQDPDADAIMTLILSSKTVSLRTLTEIADKQVKRALESVDGVGDVTMSGDRPREIHIVVDVEQLNARGLSINQVRDAIQKENVEIPGGTLEQGKWEVGLRTLGRIDAAARFNDIIIANVDGTPVRVSDVGYAEDSVQRVQNSLYAGDGSPAVQLDIRRASGENTIRVIDAVKRKLSSVRQAVPKDVTLTVSGDDSRFINASIASLEEHLLWGSLLASVVVFLFIGNIRAVIISALAIPASIIATFTLMRAMDFTLNNMTLLALTLAVGIVIDDAIVVLENIFRYIEEKRVSPFDAAIQGTREVALPVMATTLSLVVIFVPVAFMTGYARRFIYPFGWTMAFSIMVSMIVSFTLTPMLSSRFLRMAGEGGRPPHASRQEGVFHRVDQFYTASLRWTLHRPMTVIGISAAVFVLSVPLNRMIGRTFVPNEDMGEFTVHADTPQGTSLEGTTAIAQDIMRELGEQEGVSHVEYLAGADRYTHFHVFFHLLPENERKITQDEVIARVRKILAAHPGANPIVTPRNPLGGGGAGGSAISASLLGADIATLYDYSQKLLEKAKTVPSLVDVRTDYSDASPEVQVVVDRARAADLDVRMATVGDALRLMVSGDDEISSYREAGEQYPVKIRVLESQRRDIETIGKLTVPSLSGRPVRVDSIAALNRGFGPTRITRANRQFSITFSADVAPGHALDEASNDVRSLIAGLHMPAGYGSRLQGQTQNLDETTTNLIMAIALASVFVYMVLAAQFESFVQPIIIMTVLPLSVPFALFTIWITGRTLNLWSALGILLLFGIVKKNSILQVDYTNVLRARGLPIEQALEEACRTRLRPILMTTLAIVAGLVPTALGIGIGGAQRSAIAVTIIGGQSLCLFLTLLVVPATYLKLDALEHSLTNQWLKTRLSALRESTFGRLRPARSEGR
jgi:HAE1 family hydrophobic/amphiphilic exporter-1